MADLIRGIVQIAFARPVAALEFREHLARWWDGNPEARPALRRLARELFVLRTCERFELYLHQPALETGQVIEWLAHAIGCDPRSLHGAARLRQGQAAARQLLRVTAGLESAALGEPHVQGQARAAYAEALNAKSIGPVLAALGRAAIHAGKRVRTETLIAHSGQSIAEIAVESVAGNSRFLVLGAGRVAVDVLAELKAAGAGSVVVAARRQDRAKVLGDRHCAAVGPWQELAVAIRQADAVLACTAAEEYVLGLDDVTSRVTSPLTVIDLGVPRNVDPRVGRLSGVRLIHLDELTPTGGASLDELRAAEAIVNEELERFFTWLRGHAAAPVIRRLLGRSGRALDRGVLHRRIVRIKEQIAA